MMDNAWLIPLIPAVSFFVIPFEVASVLLLAALVGAVALARRD